MIAVVDYGMGNLRSVQKALQHVAPAADVAVTDVPEAIRAADRVVFPGQGAMPDCMRARRESGLGEAVARAANEKPFLGLCIGQLRLIADEKPAIVVVKTQSVHASERHVPVGFTEKKHIAVLDDDGVGNTAGGGGSAIALYARFALLLVLLSGSTLLFSGLVNMFIF